MRYFSASFLAKEIFRKRYVSGDFRTIFNDKQPCWLTKGILFAKVYIQSINSSVPSLTLYKLWEDLV